MNSKLVRVVRSPEVSFPWERVRRVPRGGKGKGFAIALKGFVIALLLVACFFAFVATMLVHYPQKTDAFLNSDEPLESKHVVISRR